MVLPQPKPIDQAQTLLKAICKGDETAFAEFYRLYEKRLYHFILLKLNDPLEASDIMHETFLEIWHHADRFEGKSKVTTWMFSIAFHKTMDRLRRKKPHLVYSDIMIETEDDQPNALTQLLSQDITHQVKFCLDKLKDLHRTVMQLAFFEDMPYRDIAMIMSCPENTIKTRMFHAKKAMKHCLQKHLGTEK